MSEFMQESSSSESSAPVSVPADTSAPAPVSTEGAPQAESEPPKPQDKPDAEIRKSLRGVEKRIGELTRQKYEAEERGRQEAEHWRQQASQYAEALKAMHNAQPLPKLEQFQDIESWAAEVAKVQADRIVSERMEQQQKAMWQQQQVQQAEQAKLQAIQRFNSELDGRLKAAEKKYPGFTERVTSAELPGMIYTPAFTAAWESESFAEIANYLAQNPDKAHQIVSLSPVSQIREIGRIEAAIAAGRTVTQAPPPPDSVGGGKGTAPKNPADMSYDEFVTWRRRSIAQQNR